MIKKVVAIYTHLAATVGHTPLIELTRFSEALDLKARILGKLESRNPTGSVKDRIAVAMIRDAEEQGHLQRGGMIVSASSGNTGIALASAATALGYDITIVMPESMSKERVAMLSMLGAKVELSPGALMGAAIEVADAILKKNPKAVRLRQFENPANSGAHYKGTGVEIWDDCEGKIDAFVAGVGTGGTLMGVGKCLKEKSDSILLVAVEPKNCAVLSGKQPGAHFIQGIGAGFVPALCDREKIDEIIPIEDDAAMENARLLARREGILAGISSGANLAASVLLARRPQMAGKTIVTILADTGERYLSTPLALDL